MEILRFLPVFNAGYLLSFTRFQIKKEKNETAKEIMPKVSSLSQGVRWVN
jgi:hypothetical protein